MTKSALYIGQVSHERVTGPRRTFRNRVMMPLVFLDEIESLRLSPLWSSRHCAPIHFRRKDFLGDPTIALDESVRLLVETEASFKPSGPIAMLGHQRTWGWLFNPIVLYYCFSGTDGSLEAVVAAVSNTPWHETHNYVIDTRNGIGDLPLQPKQMHVSPFLPMDFDYRFRLNEPAERLTFSVSVLKENQQVFRAGMTMRRQPLTRWRLTRAMLSHPFQTFRVSEGIYREALVLAFRKATFYTHPGK